MIEGDIAGLVQSIDPDPVKGGNRLGMHLRAEGQLEDAAFCFQWVLDRVPSSLSARNNLASIRIEQGRVREGLDLYRAALATDPSNFILHGNLAFASCYDDGLDGAAVLAEHRRWNDRFAAPLKRQWRPHVLPAVTPERLKIGYVSSDFRAHPVASYLEPVLGHHDRKAFEVYAYHTDERHDATTARLRGLVEHWRDCGQDPPELVAERIRIDGVHMLIDLGGQTSPANLLTFALKPAPVQAAWAGYCFSTGLDAMDYLIVDRRQVPATSEALCSETVVEMPGDNICYRPPELVPPVGPLPMTLNGFVTFGAFHNLSKMSETALKLYARTLTASPGSRLLVKSGALSDPATLEAWTARAVACGLPVERVEVLGLSDQMGHLMAHTRVDVMLDSHPYSGGVTTLESLWMGVPVVTLAGETYYSRHTTTHLGSLGLDELSTKTPEAFIAAVTALTGAPERLGALRAGLRTRMADSALCDGKGFTRILEGVYRDLWARYHGAAVS